MSKRNYCFNILYSKYKKNALKKGLKFELTKDQFYRLTRRKCYICGVSPNLKFYNHRKEDKKNAYIYNGIDRVDSSKGYVAGNVKPCCKRCNYMKRSMSLSEFKKHIAHIVRNHIK